MEDDRLGSISQKNDRNIPPSSLEGETQQQQDNPLSSLGDTNLIQDSINMPSKTIITIQHSSHSMSPTTKAVTAATTTMMTPPAGDKGGIEMDSMSLCNFTLRLPKRTLVVLLISGVMVIFWILNLFQETMMKHSPIAEFPMVMGLCYNFSSFCVARVERTITGGTKRKAPLHAYLTIGVLSALESGTSMMAIHLLNFPTWILFKSSGVLVTMLGGVLILKKRYSFPEVVRVLTIVVGLCVFLWGDITVSPDFDPRGVALVLFSMVMTALEGNFQEATFMRYSPPAAEMMLYVPFVTVGCMAPVLLYIGDLKRAFLSFEDHWIEPFLLFGMGVLNSLGYYLYLSLVKSTSALAAAMVTACRKMISITSSFWLFSKPWSSNYAIGGLLVVLALAWEFRAKSQQPTDLGEFVPPPPSLAELKKSDDAGRLEPVSPSRRDFAMFVCLPLMVATGAFVFFYGLLLPFFSRRDPT